MMGPVQCISRRTESTNWSKRIIIIIVCKCSSDFMSRICQPCTICIGSASEHLGTLYQRDLVNFLNAHHFFTYIVAEWHHGSQLLHNPRAIVLTRGGFLSVVILQCIAARDMIVREVCDVGASCPTRLHDNVVCHLDVTGGGQHMFLEFIVDCREVTHSCHASWNYRCNCARRASRHR